ncbi:MAG: patatin-like phospholipase family protein [Bdellovibrionia bacterium]
MTNTKKTSLLAFCLTLALVQGCATTRIAGPGQTDSPTAPETMGPPELYGPPPPMAPPEFAISSPHEVIQRRPVVLVFGPGLARGYSYVGVLRALKEQKIPVGAIFGTEMGGLIAALYGMSSNLNEFEWGLLKLMNDDNFLPAKSFFSKLRSEQATDGKKFEKTLRQIFGDKDLSQSKIPIRIAIQSRSTGIPIVLSRGNVVRAVRAALAAPTLFLPGTWSTLSGDIPVVSAGSSRPYLVNEAKSLGLGPTIVIDVLSEDEAASAQSELSTADLVIRPDVAGIDYLDFQKKTEAAFRGKNALIQSLEAINRLVGATSSEQ